MRTFSKRELIGSLFCPFLTLLWGIIRLLADFSWGAEFTGKGSFRLTCFVAILIGGIIPIILTVVFKIHTEEYLKKRLITIAVVYVSFNCIGMIGYQVVMFAMEMVVGVGAILFQVLKVQEESTLGRERVVLMLSDLIVYWTIYWFVFWITNW